jgi:hypothetical protein
LNPLEDNKSRQRIFKEPEKEEEGSGKRPNVCPAYKTSHDSNLWVCKQVPRRCPANPEQYTTEEKANFTFKTYTSSPRKVPITSYSSSRIIGQGRREALWLGIKWYIV